jgi:aspartate aminotransferase-like enzyme
MSSPGLSFVVLSERARKANATARLPRRYWDLADVRREVTKASPETPGTPPVHIVLQVTEALRMIHEEGFDAVIRRHIAMTGTIAQRMKALGLQPQCPSLQRRSTTVTAIAAPVGLPPRQIRDGLVAHGILVAGALERYQASAFRIGHMGDIRPADVERTLNALAQVLTDLQRN